jgi:6-phosphofructokinase 1
MNACVRAVVRTACACGMKVQGIENGLQGLIDGTFRAMGPRDVSGIIHLGGTILGTARSKDFMTPKGRRRAADNLRARDVDALVIIGGDGSFRGGCALYKEHKFPFVGLPGTIDNDMYGTDHTIGFDTAVNTAVEAIDRIRDTAESHKRLFFVEVMGRHSGAIAIASAVASGAEAVLVPEHPTNLQELATTIKAGKQRGKKSFIVVVAEGDDAGGAFNIAATMKKLTGMEPRVCILGHIQRGGTPTARDRVLAARMGNVAVHALRSGNINVFVGEVGGKIVCTPVLTVLRHKKHLRIPYDRLAEVLAT